MRVMETRVASQSVEVESQVVRSEVYQLRPAGMKVRRVLTGEDE